MKRGTIGFLLCAAFVGATSAILLFRADPEYVTVVSDDGLLTVTGFARAEGIAIVQPLHTIGIYDVTPSGGMQDLLAQLRFTSSTVVSDDVVRFNEATAMWERQNVANVDGYLVLRTAHLGRFSVFPHEDVAAPDFVSVYDALRNAAPANAVGYRIVVGYEYDAGSLHRPRRRIDDMGQQGGCGGAVMPGKVMQYSADTRSANVLVNDVQTLVDFTFFATWFVDDTGCPEGVPFHSAESYGILPLSI